MKRLALFFLLTLLASSASMAEFSMANVGDSVAYFTAKMKALGFGEDVADADAVMLSCYIQERPTVAFKIACNKITEALNLLASAAQTREQKQFCAAFARDIRPLMDQMTAAIFIASCRNSNKIFPNLFPLLAKTPADIEIQIRKIISTHEAKAIELDKAINTEEDQLSAKEFQEMFMAMSVQIKLVTACAWVNYDIDRACTFFRSLISDFRKISKDDSEFEILLSGFVSTILSLFEEKYSTEIRTDINTLIDRLENAEEKKNAEVLFATMDFLGEVIRVGCAEGDRMTVTDCRLITQGKPSGFQFRVIPEKRSQVEKLITRSLALASSEALPHQTVCAISIPLFYLYGFNTEAREIADKLIGATKNSFLLKGIVICYLSKYDPEYANKIADKILKQVEVADNLDDALYEYLRALTIFENIGEKVTISMLIKRAESRFLPMEHKGSEAIILRLLDSYFGETTRAQRIEEIYKLQSVDQRIDTLVYEIIACSGFNPRATRALIDHFAQEIAATGDKKDEYQLHIARVMEQFSQLAPPAMQFTMTGL